MKLTYWLPADVKPVHVGDYEVCNGGPVHGALRLLGRYTRQGSSEIMLRYWNGAEWLAHEGGWTSVMGKHPAHQWRGLAKQPE